MDDLVSRARDLAHRAHAGQVDKAGRPYIEHVARVAATVRSQCCRAGCASCDEAEAVAWLHDVYEDCAVEFCREVDRFPVPVVAACMRLTRGTYPGEYYEAIREQPIAVRVKLADIADNADESRLALLDEATANRLRQKYAKALRMLGATPNA